MSTRERRNVHPRPSFLHNYARPESYGPPEIDPNEIILDEFIGEGTYGNVYKGRCRSTLVAVKLPRRQNLTQKEIEDFKQEVAIMSQIFHPNVVLFMGACTQPGSIKIVTEKMETDLDRFLHQNQQKARAMSPFQRMKMAKGAAQGMSWLHGINDIIHRDLKPANLLIDKNYNVKVTDFGFSRILKGSNSMRDVDSTKGSALWMSPELLKNEEFDKSADIYAFGIILWEIFTLNEPWEGIEDWPELVAAVVTRGERPPLDLNCPTSLRELISTCWDAARSKRPTFPEIVCKLDEVMLQFAIEDTLGQHFWKEFYLLQELEESVDWKYFSLSLSDATGVETQLFEPLYPFLVNSEHQVHIESFSHVLNWFGSDFLREPESVTREALQQIQHLLKKPWFHGTISQNDADTRLALHSDGTYLVRLSKTLTEYPYTLSLIKNFYVQHIRIRKQTGTEGNYSLSISGHEGIYSNLVELIEGILEVLNLTQPCPKPVTTSGYL